MGGASADDAPAEAPVKQARAPRAEREPRPAREERPAREARPPREERAPRPERAARPARPPVEDVDGQDDGWNGPVPSFLNFGLTA